jgi:hypothetical protein
MPKQFFARLAPSLAALLLFSFAVAAQGKRRDHLTPQEADLVREAQLIDARAKVFTKAAERRFLALTNPAAATSKEAVKDAETWGAFPQGTRAELLGDLAGILDEAINNIDGIAERKPDDKLLPKAVRVLAAGCQRWLPTLQTMRENAKGPELIALNEAVEYAESILEAGGKLPPEEKKDDKKKP